MPELLTMQELDTALAGLTAVHKSGTSLLRVRVKAPGFPQAVELVSRVALSAEEMNHHPDIDIRFDKVTFTLSTHSSGGVTALDVELAQRIMMHVDAVGAQALQPAARVELAIDTLDAAAIRPFWRAGLGYVERRGDEGIELHNPDEVGPVVWFQPMDEPRTGRGRIHFDVYVSFDDAPKRVADVVEAGGRLVTDEFAPDWWVLADAEGNELCVCTQ
ncbi:4a-hydroxytetrahydrobiopterin dehydratase [Kineosporia succinea]|uniref:Putative pterin-4-alpha-carbinolamine dehydratase n=1 Tax=Kineosporia succinea TaxID=84632 RepID=A0ABT9NZ33_9ACTN|nr:4a-hydroxytetrahydrobiopterin dehydratase [Kineosporia succinea]MDP9825512.1 4a-hydroxytetrahydrobiopterin dehydratase [Kineosporia succinea]